MQQIKNQLGRNLLLALAPLIRPIFCFFHGGVVFRGVNFQEKVSKDILDEILPHSLWQHLIHLQEFICYLLLNILTT